MSVAALPDLNVLPAEALKALILAQHDQLIATREQLLSRENEIEHLKLLIAKLQRMQFGRKSEKLQRQIEQLELWLEELQANREETSSAESQPAAPPILITTPAAKPVRRALPEHLPRETQAHVPKRIHRRLDRDMPDLIVALLEDAVALGAGASIVVLESGAK